LPSTSVPTSVKGIQVGGGVKTVVKGGVEIETLDMFLIKREGIVRQVLLYYINSNTHVTT
jgi:hypothetical protein